MLYKDRDGLICDLAEVYGIYDMRALPVSTLAALAAGLGPDTRVMRALSGRKLTLTEQLTAMLVDSVRLVFCALTGADRPKSVLELLTEDPKDGIRTAEDFEAARAAFLKDGD